VALSLASTASSRAALSWAAAVAEGGRGASARQVRMTARNDSRKSANCRQGGGGGRAGASVSIEARQHERRVGGAHSG
jgi:hypothetical protein